MPQAPGNNIERRELYLSFNASPAAVNPPGISPPAGFYSGGQRVTLLPAISGDSVYYTLDGSLPGRSSRLYTGPIVLDSSRVIRACSFNSGSVSRVITATYILDYSTALPVVSLSTDPKNLWDYYTGIYVMGPNASPDPPYKGANFWQDWERQVHMEFFGQIATDTFSIDAGVKIHGGFNRSNPQKSLAINARSIYGPKKINFQIFPRLPFKSYDDLILRNSGNDWNKSMFRDAFMQSITAELGLESQAYRPSVVFLNGRYWGLHDIREKVNAEYISRRFSLAIDSIDMLEDNGMVITGSNLSYGELISFLMTSDMTLPSSLQYAEARMDIGNFIDYELSQIYFDNRDWPGNNIKYWKHKGPKGRWRWIVYDTDYGFGLSNPANYSFNTLAFATAPNGNNSSNNPPWSTLLLRKLLENPQFRARFINRFADLSNTLFRPDAVISRIKRFSDEIRNEIPAHFNRWNAPASSWQTNIQTMETFASQRIDHMYGHFSSFFSLQGTAGISLNITNPGQGRIKINSLTIDKFPWSGKYFKDHTISLTAYAKPGYRFVKWQGSFSSTSPSINIEPGNTMELTAVFEASGFKEGDIVINEINYNSSPLFDTDDWIELHNLSTSASIDLSGWIFKDEDNSHLFTLPPGTEIKAGGYLVLCKDTAAFRVLFPEVNNRLGNFGFGLSAGGDMLRLLNNFGDTADSLVYSDQSPWPLSPDGQGATLELINPEWDNRTASSWSASQLHGTPGKVNGAFSSADYLQEGQPEGFYLNENYPNPFNNSTVISFLLPEPEHIRLKIYDMLGREIRTLINGFTPSGRTAIKWNGTDDSGSPVSTGIYILRLDADRSNAVRKMVLMK